MSKQSSVPALTALLAFLYLVVAALVTGAHAESEADTALVHGLWIAVGLAGMIGIGAMARLIEADNHASRATQPDEASGV